MDTQENVQLYYASIADVVALNPFPKTDPEKVLQNIVMRAGELNTLLMTKGIEVPVTAPSHFVNMLRMAVTYGAAGMVEGAPVRGVDPRGVAENVNMYLSEYNRIKDWINSFDREALLNMGLISVELEANLRGSHAGLLLARPRGLRYVNPLHAYPFDNREID